jgi:RNA polymerase sigma factor (TIGR02999 family)
LEGSGLTDAVPGVCASIARFLRFAFEILALIIKPVREVTRMLEAIQQGDPTAAEELLPLVYDELRKLAAHKMAREASGQTLQPTDLVHEAWIRLAGGKDQHWDNRAHFFAAAAEAMRRILVERARRRQRFRHGGGQQRAELEEEAVSAPADDDKILAVSEALEALQAEDPLQGQVVKLRFFVGLSEGEVAKALGVSEKTVQRYWVHAKAWLYERIQQEGAHSLG